LFQRSACALRFGASPETLTNEQHLVPSALVGDSWALDVVRSGSEPLARVLATAITLCGLDRVFLIGGFPASLGAVYLQMIRDLVAQASAYAVLCPAIRQVVEMSEDDVCLRGAAAYAQRIPEGCGESSHYRR
jgi:predicted NBD/HSP70 family sugar kinase